MTHVFLVALVVEGDVSRETAEEYLMSVLPSPYNQYHYEDKEPAVESWWIAEDDRHDGSDNDSAVFVIPGKQMEAYRRLRTLGLTPVNNDPYYEKRGTTT